MQNEMLKKHSGYIFITVKILFIFLYYILTVVTVPLITTRDAAWFVWNCYVIVSLASPIYSALFFIYAKFGIRSKSINTVVKILVIIGFVIIDIVFFFAFTSICGMP